MEMQILFACCCPKRHPHTLSPGATESVDCQCHIQIQNLREECARWKSLFEDVDGELEFGVLDKTSVK